MNSCRPASYFCCFFIAFALSLVPPVRAAEVAAPGRSDSATSAMLLDADGLARLTRACGAQLGDTPFDAFRNRIQCLQAWTEYQPSTCKPISPGSYRVDRRPRFGALSYGLITGRLANGACPGKTFSFRIAYYKWTNTAAWPKQDLFTIRWVTPDGLYNLSFPMIANRAPRITGETLAWWFNGEKPGGYKTELILKAQPAGAGPYTWRVETGTGRVQLDGRTGPVTTLTTRLGSRALNDVVVTVTARASKSAPHRLTVRQPKSLSFLRNVDKADPTWGYETEIHYAIRDQFNQILPANVPLNEHWTSGVVSDFAGMDWRPSDNKGAVVAPADWPDVIQGEMADHHPVPRNPQTPLLGRRVNHWNGKWSIGSTDANAGKGLRVQTNTWQKYLDHARHTNVVSPTGDPVEAPAPARAEPVPAGEEVP